jgi:signal peptidase I
MGRIVRAAAIVLSAVLFIAVIFCSIHVRSFIEAFKTSSSAMEPTLIPGDLILVNKVAYAFRTRNDKLPLIKLSRPRRGEVVVLRISDDPETERDESSVNIIKRVAALPGEKVEVRGPQLLVNDAPVQETLSPLPGETADFPPRIVPPHEYFVVGDNMGKSHDSRTWPYPFVREERVPGRVFMIYANPKKAERSLSWVK